MLKRFTLANTDDLDHITRRRRIYRYLRYRHRRLGNTVTPLNRIHSITSVKLEHTPGKIAAGIELGDTPLHFNAPSCL